MKYLLYLLLVCCLFTACGEEQPGPNIPAVSSPYDQLEIVEAELHLDPAVEVEVTTPPIFVKGPYYYTEFYELRVNGCRYLVTANGSGVHTVHQANCPNHSTQP